MSVLIDIMIVLVLVGCLLHGLRHGFIRTVGSIAGLVAGGAAAWFAAPPIGALVQDATGRVLLTLGVALVLVLIGAGVGARIGAALGRPLRRTVIGPVDRALGAVLQVAAGAVAVSVLASLALAFGSPEVAKPVADSVVAQRIEALTPAPVVLAVDGIKSGVLSAGAGAIGSALGGAPATR